MAARAQGCSCVLLSNLHQELLSSPADGHTSRARFPGGKNSSASFLTLKKKKKPSVKIADLSLAEEAFLLRTPELLERV